MSQEFRLPDLGENVTEGQVVRLLVAEGDSVKANQPVLELETDKALLEVPAPAPGRVAKIHALAGRKLKINDLILTLEPAGGAPAAAEAAAKAAAPAPVPAPAPPPAVSPVPAPAPAVALPPAASEAPPAAEARVVPAPGTLRAVAASPSTRRAARELGVDLAEVAAKSPGGRVTEEDVKAFVRNRAAAPPPSPGRTGPIPAGERPLPDFSRWGPVERKPLSGVRRATMAHLSYSWNAIPHVTHLDEADVTELESLRRRHSERAAAKGGKLTATVFVVKAAVAALKEFPWFNASIDPATEELILKDYHHIGIAVDTEHGLLVPVIRDAGKKHLLDLSGEVALISERARQRKLSLEDMRGGTFTITNLGGIGGLAFTPIINWPEVAILGLARYQKRLQLKGDRMETRTYLPLCLSYDHRVIDGADAARFTRKLASLLEDPAMLLLEG